MALMALHGAEMARHGEAWRSMAQYGDERGMAPAWR